jgi:hypothetical protein
VESRSAAAAHALVEAFERSFDMADLPRMTAHIYQTNDEMHGYGGK